MRNPNLVSIITPAYNAERFLAETVASVQAQTHTNWEMLIVDDGSSDGTLKLVDSLMRQDSRIKLFTQKNQGPAAARNLALENANGRYLAFLDADDIWLPHKLEMQLAFMKEKNAALVFSQYRRFIGDPEQTGRVIEVPNTVTYRELLSHNVIATLTTMVDREKTGPFTMKKAGYDDFVLWLEILKRGFTGYGIQQDLARYRLVPGSVSSKRTRAAKWVWRIYRDFEKLSLLDAAFQFVKYAVKVSLKHSRH